VAAPPPPIAALPPPAVDPAKPCRGQGTRLEVIPPSAADLDKGQVAMLSASFAGQGMGPQADAVCLVRAGRDEALQPEVQVAVRAHPTELQRIVVEGRPILLRIPPSGRLHISYHPCMFWQLGAPWFDSGSMGDRTTYRRADEDCPRGYADGDRILEADDPLCPSDAAVECRWRRCIVEATIRFVGSGRVKLLHDDGDEEGDAIALEPADKARPQSFKPYGGQCPHFKSIDTGSERVRIAPGIGEQWTLTVDAAGKLLGTSR
jgi:hypothetical protein